MFSSNTSSSGVTPDPQFNYVTMLLHGNGTNGAQNNTFLDSSTNNFTITRNGNTTQGTFTPYGSNWSNYFDGSGDSLTAPSNAAFGFGTGDFTIEAFCFIENTGGFIFAVPDGSGDSLLAYLNSSNQIQVYYPGAGNFISTSGQRSIWAHVAVSRNSGTLRVFVNGTLVNSTSNSKNWPTTNFEIGTSSVYGGSATGYISNVRVLKGTGLYTSAFTPPTTPLTAITNTSLLTCQSNRFIDNSSNNFTITRNGDVSVQRFSPFNPTASYTAATIGGSGHFDMDASGGVRTWLTAAGTYSLSGDFTVEGFFYNKNISTYTGYNGVFSNNGAFTFYCNATTITCGLVSFGSPELGLSLSVSTPLVGNWVHFAIVRQSGSCALYLNGSRVSTASVSSSISISNNFVVGNTQNFNSGYGMVGYISDFQLTNGTAKYDPSSTTISVPTAPMSVSGKTLALQFTNGGIIDNAMMNDLETVGTAQISTAQSKFGTGSMYFSGGSTGWLYSSQIASINGQLGTTYTIEMFIRVSNVTSFATFFRTTVTSTGNTTIRWRVGGGDLFFDSLNSDNATTTRISGGGLSVDTWYHIAVSVSQNSGKMFVNGTQVGSTMTFNPSSLIADTLYIGELTSASGYIDDLRITKGVARYTANFTPPAAPFPDQ